MFLIPAIILLLSAPPPPNPTNSIVKLAQPGHICTGVVVRLTQVISAEHCVEDGLILAVDGLEAKVIKRSTNLVLLDVPGLVKPALKLGKTPERGDEVFTWGYAYNMGLALLVRHVANFLDPYIVLDGPSATGMSGGPTINQRGELIGINQGTDKVSHSTSIISGTDEIREFLHGK